MIPLAIVFGLGYLIGKPDAPPPQPQKQCVVIEQGTPRERLVCEEKK